MEVHTYAPQYILSLFVKLNIKSRKSFRSRTHLIDYFPWRKFVWWIFRVNTVYTLSMWSATVQCVQECIHEQNVVPSDYSTHGPPSKMLHFCVYWRIAYSMCTILLLSEDSVLRLCPSVFLLESTYVLCTVHAIQSSAILLLARILLFSLQARDGGGKAVSAPIIITVADINDNAPVFQGQFDRTIPENFFLVDTVWMGCHQKAASVVRLMVQ